MKNNENTLIEKEYIGVYGIHQTSEGQVLLILKARGPYKGMYDLPGGGIEEDETKVAALKREFEEEIGSSPISSKFLFEDFILFPYLSQSKGKVNFRHKGYFYLVTLANNAKIKTSPDGFDSMGAIYINIKDIIENKVMVAPMAKKAILEAINAS